MCNAAAAMAAMACRWEVYLLCVVGAVATAPYSALCRSIMAELVPHTHTSTVHILPSAPPLHPLRTPPAPLKP